MMTQGISSRKFVIVSNGPVVAPPMRRCGRRIKLT